VRVGPALLREVVEPLADRKIGAVTSFYRGIAENNLGAEIEGRWRFKRFFRGSADGGMDEGIHLRAGTSIATTRMARENGRVRGHCGYP